MNFRQQNYAVKTFKILSNANRIKIVDLLAKSGNKKITVNEIAEKLSLEANNVSNHLLRLRENGILRAKQDGTNMYYQVKDVHILEFLKLAKKLA